MAKRFTDSSKWNGWFRKLKPCNKLLWFYILDNCDLSGVWRVDKDLAEFSIGCEVKWDEAVKNFKEQIYVFDNGDKWYIIDFVKFQNGEELTKSPVHKKIFNMLVNYGLAEIFVDEEKRLLDRVSNRVLHTPVVEVKVIVEEVVEVKEEKDTEKIKEPEAVLWPSFDDFWNLYDKKVDRHVCEKKWNKLLQSDKEVIIHKIPDYVKSTPEKKFRKNPETYLNDKAWNNEIIESNATEGNKINNQTSPAGVYEFYRNQPGK